MPNVYSSKRPPSVGKEVGDVHFHTVTKEVFVVLGDLRLWNMSGLLSPDGKVAVVGPKGEQGSVGATGAQGPAARDGRNGADSTVPGPQGARGPKGADGLPGPAGKNGADSTVPGPAGKSIVGPPGPKGDKGDPGSITVIGDAELKAAVTFYKQRHTAVQAALLAEIAKSKNLPASTRLHVLNTLNRVKKEAGL